MFAFLWVIQLKELQTFRKQNKRTRLSNILLIIRNFFLFASIWPVIFIFKINAFFDLKRIYKKGTISFFPFVFLSYQKKTKSEFQIDFERRSKLKPPRLFFNDFESTFRLKCNNCNTSQEFFNWIMFSGYPDKPDRFITEFQCQLCGKLVSIPKEMKTTYNTVTVDTKCSCGGTLRRDKPIFCPTCKYNQTDENTET